MRGKLFGALPLFESFLLAAIQRDIEEMVRKMEIMRDMGTGREMEMGR
jgi:hypothetical protein